MRIAAIVLALAIMIGILVYLWRGPSAPAPTASTPAAEATPLPTSNESAARPLVFQNLMVVESARVTLDGKVIEDLPCDPAKPGTPIGALEIAPGQTGELTCIADSNGGISLKLAGGESVIVGQVTGGEEGTGSDTRTWFTRKDGNLIIKKATISSSEDVENPGPVDCNKSAELIQFDATKKGFSSTKLSFDANELDFVPPVSVDERCLNP